jgi:hypothetical protein
MRSRLADIVLWRIWATVGAIVCGVAVATLPGGTASPWAYVVLLGALVSGAALTAIELLVRYARNRQLELGEILPIEPVFEPTDRQVQHDEDVVERLVGILREQDLDWLRGEPFTGPWRDDHVTSLREIAGFDAGQRGIFDPELVAAVATLTDAVRTFVSVYDEGTSSDPIVCDSIWRMVEGGDTTGTLFSLREKAAGVVEAYQGLLDISRRKFATAPHSRQQRRGR